MSTQTIRNGASIVVSLQPTETLKVVAVAGTYTLHGKAGSVANTTIATNATGGTYGPFAAAVTVCLMSSALSEIDFDSGTAPVIESDTPVQAVLNASGAVESLTAAGKSVPMGGGGGSGLVTGRTITVGSAAVLTDEGTIVQANSASAIALTIPNDSVVVWEADSVIAVYQVGAGVASFAQGSGVTLRVPSSYAASVQYDTIFARRVGANEWVVSK